MANVASLAVQLTAHTDRFKRGITGAIAPLRLFQGAVDSANARFAAFSGALIGGITATALGAFVKRSGDAVAQLGPLSDRLNVSTEALHAFRLGAKKANIDFETLSGGIEFFSRNLAKANAGGEDAAKIFEALQLDPAQFVGMDTAQAIAVVADQINGLANANDRLLVSAALFGKGAGADFVTFLKDGSEGLDAMIQRSAELGGAFSRIDVQTIDNANSKLDELYTVLSNAAAVLAMELSPYIEAATNSFVQLGAQGTKTGEIILNFVESVAKGVSYLIDGWQLLNIFIKGTQVFILTTAAAIVKAFDEVQFAIDTAFSKLPYFKDKIVPKKQFEALGDALMDQAKDVGKEFAAMTQDKWSHENVDEYFANIREQARATAEQQVMNNDVVGSSLDDLFAKQERGVGNFQQTTIGGLRNVLSNAMRGTDLASMQASGVSDLGRQQRVQDPQLATTNKYLQQIAKNTENQAAVAA